MDPEDRLMNVLVRNGTTESPAREIARFVADRLGAHDHATMLVDPAAGW